MSRNQLMEDIAQLQTLENDLFNQLKEGIASNSLSENDKKSLLFKINGLTNVRINLYKSLNKDYQLQRSTIETAHTLLGDQRVAIDIAEKSLNSQKTMLGSTNQTGSVTNANKNNTRLTLNNIYYSKWYLDHGQIFKNIVIVMLCLIALFAINRVFPLPSQIYGPAMILILVLGFVYVGNQILLASSRDNLNYDEFDWGFDAITPS